MVARLDVSVSFASVRSHLRKLGYARDGRVWTTDSDSTTSSPELASTLSSIAVLPGHRLVVAADRAGVRVDGPGDDRPRRALAAERTQRRRCRQHARGRRQRAAADRLVHLPRRPRSRTPAPTSRLRPARRSTGPASSPSRSSRVAPLMPAQDERDVAIRASDSARPPWRPVSSAHARRSRRGPSSGAPGGSRTRSCLRSSSVHGSARC